MYTELPLIHNAPRRVALRSQHRHMSNKILRIRQTRRKRAFLLKISRFNMCRWHLRTHSLPEADVRGGSGPSEPGQECQCCLLLQTAPSAKPLSRWQQQILFFFLILYHLP